VAGRTAALLAVGLTVIVAGCGGGKTSYTYSFTASGNAAFSKGIYLTIISPIKVPASAFKGGRMVDHVSGPEACSFSQVVKNAPAKYAQFDGKKLTIKIYGSVPVAKLICNIAQKSGATEFFKP
jgi:hypothetical protein